MKKGIIAIVDDCESDRNAIADQVQRNLSKDIAAEIELMSKAEDLDPSVFFLACFIDIDLAGSSGIHLGEAIHSFHPEIPVVFVTAHDELVFQSFMANPFYFVRKSTLSADMSAAMELINKKLASADERLTFSYNGELWNAKYNDIRYVQKQHNDLYIAASDKTYRIRMSLIKLEPDLKKHGFIRISSSVMINPLHVSELRESKIVMADETFAVSRRNLPEVKRQLMCFFRGEYL